MIHQSKRNFQNHPFHLVSPSPWPLFTSISLFVLTTATVCFMHGFEGFQYLVIFLNTWLLKAHVESPLSGSIILAGIVLKLSL